MTKAWQAALAIATLVLFAAIPAHAVAAPANDNFSAATPLAVGQEISDTNLDATAESGEPAPGPPIGPCAAITDGAQCAASVWFTFQPAQSGQYTIETCDLGTDMDTVLAVYTGATIGAASLVVANDDGPSPCGGGSSGTFGSQVTFSATAGTVYHVDLNGFGGDQGSFYLRAYAGSGQPRPEPDTHILRFNSFAAASIGGAGVITGPRHSASFGLASSTFAAPFECSLDGAAFTACDSLMSYDLSPGTSHTFATRSVAGSSTDPTPAIERFTIDATPPETALNSGPMGDTNNQTAEWITSSSERITSGGGFRCSIDGQRTVGCGGDMQYSDLCQGSHTFRSAAFDPASNLDPTPVVAQVNETAGPPCAAPTIGSSTTTTPSPTSASITFPYDDKGAGGTIHLDYGPTAAYGTTIGDQNAQPGLPDVRSIGFGFLAPGTLYHYRLTITTPFGTASTPDQTVTTLPLGGTLPIVGGGSSPTVVGHHAVRIPFTLDPAGVNTSFAILISANGPPIPGDSPSIFFFLQPVKGSSSGPQPANAEIVDLDPGTTYRYRVEAFHSGTDSNSVLGPEGSFTVPAIAPVLAKSHFKLRKNLVAVGKLKRGSRKLTIKVHGLPGDTLVDVGLKVRKAKAKGHKKAAANGKARVTLNFKRKLRKALHKKRVKSATLKVSVTPPGDTVSSVTLRLHLKH